MIETVIIIRNKKDITDYVNDPILFVSPKNDLSLDKLKKRLHDYLKDYKQFSFIQSTGHVVAAIDKKNQLLVALP